MPGILQRLSRKNCAGRKFLGQSSHEITPAAVRAGLASTRPVDMALVDAQQARRILDRLVGYKLSPLLWKQIKRPWVRGKKPPALSAGRVQTVALRLVVEKDREIEAFAPEEYWTLDVELAAYQAIFKARLVQINGKEPGMLKQPAVKAVMEDLQSAAWLVGKVEHKEEKRYPYPPFTTQHAPAGCLGQVRVKTQEDHEGGAGVV